MGVTTLTIKLVPELRAAVQYNCISKIEIEVHLTSKQLRVITHLTATVWLLQTFEVLVRTDNQDTHRNSTKRMATSSLHN